MTVRMEQTENGLLIKTEDGFDVYVVPMIYNYRITLSQEGDVWGYVAGWCYFGTDDAALLKAITAALTWTGLATTSPEGFDKCVGDRRAW